MRRHLGFLFLIMCVLPNKLSAQTWSHEPNIPILLSDLDSDDYHAREQAFTRLMKTPAAIQQIKDAYKNAKNQNHENQELQFRLSFLLRHYG